MRWIGGYWDRGLVSRWRTKRGPYGFGRLVCGFCRYMGVWLRWRWSCMLKLQHDRWISTSSSTWYLVKSKLGSAF